MSTPDCRAAVYKHGAVECTALRDTNFGVRACPFYKPLYIYNRDLNMIERCEKGYTPIVVGRS